MSIGGNLKRLREGKGLTQEGLAKRVGISQTMVAQVERGSKTLTLPTADAVCKALGCTLYDLLEG